MSTPLKITFPDKAPGSALLTSDINTIKSAVNSVIDSIGNVNSIISSGWSATTEYTTSNIIRGNDGNIYIATGSSKGTDPVADNGSLWLPLFIYNWFTVNVGPINRKFTTIDGAMYYLRSIAMVTTGQGITIQVDPGTYVISSSLSMNHRCGDAITLQGDTTGNHMSNYILDASNASGIGQVLYVTAHQLAGITGFTFKGNATVQGIVANRQTTINWLNSCVFTNCCTGVALYEDSYVSINNCTFNGSYGTGIACDTSKATVRGCSLVGPGASWNGNVNNTSGIIVSHSGYVDAWTGNSSGGHINEISNFCNCVDVRDGSSYEGAGSYFHDCSTGINVNNSSYAYLGNGDGLPTRIVNCASAATVCEGSSVIQAGSATFTNCGSSGSSATFAYNNSFINLNGVHITNSSCGNAYVVASQYMSVININGTVFTNCTSNANGTALYQTTEVMSSNGGLVTAFEG